MKLWKRGLALALCAGLLGGVPARGAEIMYGDTSIGIRDELMENPTFAKWLESALADATEQDMPVENFLEVLDRLIQDAQLPEGVTEAGTDPHAGEEGVWAQAEYDFDAATGTLRGVTVTGGGATLRVPEEIGGAAVRTVGPYAFDGLDLYGIILPHTVERLDAVIARNCPYLEEIAVPPTATVTGRLYENCPELEALNDATPYFEMETENKLNDRGEYEGTQINLPQTLLRRLGVFQGSGQGMNWEGGLTRAEAATVLLRLIGAEEEAKAAADKPSPFTDVPDWAKGYVNCAYEKGMVKGVGDGRFDPGGACGAQEFCLMLLRLTAYTEGSDYGWATAISDCQRLIEEYRVLEQNSISDIDSHLFAKLYNDGAFTRELACALSYRMLSVRDGGPGDRSLGDTLLRAGAHSAIPFFDYGVRVTTGALAEPGRMEFYLADNRTPTVVELKGNTLSVSGAGEPQLAVAPYDGGGYDTAGTSARLDGPARISLSATWTQGNGAPITSSFNLLVREGAGGTLYLDMERERLQTYLISRDEAAKREPYERAAEAACSQDIQELADRLTAGKSGDYAKAEAICLWVQENIAYDYDTYRAIEDAKMVRYGMKDQPTGGLDSADQDADTVLRDRTGVCAGYSNLTYALLNAAGIPCIRVSSQRLNHAWNEARIDGRSVCIDNTWGDFDTAWDSFYAAHIIGRLPFGTMGNYYY